MIAALAAVVAVAVVVLVVVMASTHPDDQTGVEFDAGTDLEGPQ